jgi:hypothetical protein
VTARDVLDGIKARLSAATPGPWDRLDAQIRHTQIDGWVDPDGRAAAQAQTESDIQFVMSAPTDVARLTAAVDAALLVAEEFDAKAGHRWASSHLRAAIENALAPK